jgi:hypothetical protein
MVRYFHFGEGLGAALEHGDWIEWCHFCQESSLVTFIQIFLLIVCRLVFPLLAPIINFQAQGMYIRA